MAFSNQYAVGTAPALIVTAPPGLQAGPSGAFYLANGNIAVFLGASGVSSANGAQVASAGTFTSQLFPGDQIYACTASGTSTLGVLVTGA